VVGEGEKMFNTSPSLGLINHPILISICASGFDDFVTHYPLCHYSTVTTDHIERNDIGRSVPWLLPSCTQPQYDLKIHNNEEKKIKNGR
jgi:hypothetical protein